MDKKALRRQYEQLKHPMGCFMVSCTQNQEIYIGVTKDLDAIKQRILFRLSVGALSNLTGLQSMYRLYGEQAIGFSVLDILDETEAQEDVADANLALLLQLHGENHPNAKEIRV